MVKHFVTFKGVRKQVTYDWPEKPSSLGASTYIQGTRTSDTCRFANTKDLPLNLRFTDASNVEHEICLQGSSNEYTISIMCNHQIFWHGDEKDRTGLDAQSGVAKVTFSYVESSWFHSHGIQVSVTGYRPEDMGYYKSDSESWQSAVEMFVQGTQGVKNLSEAYANVKGGK